MPSLLDDIESLIPGLWAQFCERNGDDARQWTPKLAGMAHCLDREWRKIVFKLLDFYLESQGAPGAKGGRHRPDARRYDVIVHPFKYYYGQVFRHPEILGSDTRAELLKELEDTTCCPANFSSKWPWSAVQICEAYATDMEAEVEAFSILNTNGIDQLFANLLHSADMQDLSRTIFSAMNSSPRRDIMEHHRLQHIMSLIQRIIDARTVNTDLLRMVLYDIVAERCVVPHSLMVTGITWNAAVAPGTNGGFADIFRGFYQGEEVALKKLRGFDGHAARDALVMLLKEATVWYQLKHENILSFYGIADTLSGSDGPLVLVSPWMEHGDLHHFSLLENGREFSGPDFMLQIARGLEYLHSQEPPVIHGDLRGSNILVSGNDTKGYTLRLTDFGIAEIEQIRTKVTTQEPRGCARWMAPEILKPFDDSYGKLTQKSDIYAYAMTCIEILSGQVPFPELRTEHQFLLHVINFNGQPERPPAEPVAGKRGLDDLIWSLIDLCCEQVPTRRPPIKQIMKTLEDYSPMSPNFETPKHGQAFKDTKNYIRVDRSMSTPIQPPPRPPLPARRVQSTADGNTPPNRSLENESRNIHSAPLPINRRGPVSALSSPPLSAQQSSRSRSPIPTSEDRQRNVRSGPVPVNRRGPVLILSPPPSRTPLSSRPSSPTSGALPNERATMPSHRNVRGAPVVSQSGDDESEEEYIPEPDYSTEDEADSGADCRKEPLPKNFVYRQLVKHFPEEVNTYRSVKKFVEKIPI